MAENNTWLSLARQGRRGDTTLAHLTPGEVILPQEAAVRLKQQIEAILGKGSVERATVGSPEASINPETGMEEFGLTGRSKRRKRKARRAYQIQQQKLEAQHRLNMEQQETLHQQRLKKYQEQEDTLAKEQEKRLMISKISNIKKRRKLGALEVETTTGLATGIGETMSTEPLSTGGPRYSGRKRGKKPQSRFSGAAIPTMRIGGSYRPQ